MPRYTWQRSSYCGSGDSCIHIAATPGTVHLTESSDPTGAILTATPATFATFLTALKRQPHSDRPAIQATLGKDDTVRIHNTTAPHTTVTTTRPEWDAFVLGVQAGEFDHFGEDGRARQ
ncbi:DUF397 domain-containing protein [Streptomyces sp. NPDC046909]|uniref:DUF397 domain-containing protein n=1 Tax=Streptomyces sp. NPDC046909 TaxID=3155617 RepID=UPI003410A792